MWSGSCAKRGGDGIQQITVLRFENISPEASSDWVGRGVAEGLAAAIAPSAAVNALNAESLHRFDASLGKRISAAPGISAELPNARLAFATRVIYGYYQVRLGDRVEVSAVELDATTQQTRKVASVAGAVRQLPQLTEQLAQALGYATRPPLTLNEAALRSYSEGLEAPSVEAARDKYQEAVAADPVFGAAYAAWVRTGVALHDRALFDRAMAQAERHGGQITPYYRATLAALQAEARGDARARVAALDRLSRTAPADPLILRFLGDAELAAGNYRGGSVHYEQAARATPQDPDLRNLLAYAYLAQDNESAAMRQAAEYARLAPEGGNTADTLGDVQFHFNHFEQAAKSYLEASGRDPEMNAGASLEKAAVSQLLAGDLQKANELHQRYVQARTARHEPGAELRQADWYFLTGHKREAIESARAIAARAGGMPPLRVAALTRAAAWELVAGRAGEAAQSARAAMALAQPGERDLPALLESFAESLNDAEFSRRLDQFYAGPANQDRRLRAEGYRLLLRREWERALPVWKTLAANPREQTARAIYAWVLLQSGRKPEAAQYAATTPVWDPNQNDVFTGLWFPRLLAVRAAAGPDAERAARVYKALGGDLE